MKKIFIISSVLLGVVLLFLGIYNFAFKKNTQTATKTNSETSTITETATKNETEKVSEKIVAVSDGAVIGAVFDKKSEELKYYTAKDGVAWKSDSLGVVSTTLSETKVTGLKTVAWSPDRSKVLTTTEKNGQVSFYEYDYNLKKGTLLKSGLDMAVWDNSGSKIFYKYFDEASKARTLNIANPDGSEWQKIADLEFRKISIAPVPAFSIVSFWNFPTAKEESKLQVVGVNGGEVRTVLSGRFGGDYLWSPDGKEALVSSLPSSDGHTVSLGLVTIDGKYSDLNIPTLASKCVWSVDNKTVYYALPGEIPESSIMPDDYQENKFNTNDTFWKMNVKTGEKERIVDTKDITKKYDSSEIFLSATEDALYFKNRIDQKLYKISL